MTINESSHDDKRIATCDSDCFNDQKNGFDGPTAGLPLSVGAASFGSRCFLVLMFGLVGAICLAGAVAIGRLGPMAATVLAIVAIVPLGCISLIAAVFTVAPFSRFGVRLDRFVGGLTWVRLALVFAGFWLLGVILVL